MTSVDYYIPDAEASTSSHVIAAYLDAYTAPEGLVVDPFCQSSVIVLEALRAGRRVIATNLDPLDALRTRLAVTTLSARDLDVAVTRLADSRKLDTSLQEHLLRLYRTTCRHCHKMVIAECFIWEREQSVPKRVSYRCPFCGEAGVYDCDESDIRVFQEVQPRGLHYWYILDRIARHEDRGRRLIEKLLELYTPRNLYVLTNLALKIDDLLPGMTAYDFMRLALLHALRLGSKLNPAPGEPAPSHAQSLTPPFRFLERNAWQLFTDAARGFAQRPALPSASLAASVREVAGPSSASVARAFIGHMSVRQLTRELTPASVSLVFTQPPLLGRTRWALSYLWTGWLYGHTVASALWPLIRRHASDWPFYLRAMRATLLALQRTLAPSGRIVLVGESTGLAYHEALALAAAGASLRLQSALYHPHESETATKPFAGLRGDYRLTWMHGPPVPPGPMWARELAENIKQIAVAAGEEILERRGEPAPFVRLHCAILEALAQRNMLQRIMAVKEQPALPNALRDQIRAALEEQVGRIFIQLWKDEEKEECMWWLLRPPPDVVPLTEQVEQAMREALNATEPMVAAHLMRAVYARFPGMLTPDAEWVTACLKSYGQPIDPERWTLRAEDRPTQRTTAREAVLRTLSELGQLLGYDLQFETGGFDLFWASTQRNGFAFVVLDALALSRLLNLRFESGLVRAARFAIIPEARSGLLHLKFARFPWLRKQLASAGWQFIKDAELPEWVNKTTQEHTQLSLM